jgi:hypothetical protein
MALCKTSSTPCNFGQIKLWSRKCATFSIYYNTLCTKSQLRSLILMRFDLRCWALLWCVLKRKEIGLDIFVAIASAWISLPLTLMYLSIQLVGTYLKIISNAISEIGIIKWVNYWKYWPLAYSFFVILIYLHLTLALNLNLYHVMWPASLTVCMYTVYHYNIKYV